MTGFHPSSRTRSRDGRRETHKHHRRQIDRRPLLYQHCRHRSGTPGHRSASQASSSKSRRVKINTVSTMDCEKILCFESKDGDLFKNKLHFGQKRKNILTNHVSDAETYPLLSIDLHGRLLNQKVQTLIESRRNSSNINRSKLNAPHGFRSTSCPYQNHMQLITHRNVRMKHPDLINLKRTPTIH